MCQTCPPVPYRPVQPPGHPKLAVALDATPLLGTRTGVGQFCAMSLQYLAERDDLDVGAFAVSWRRRNGLGGQLPAGVRTLGRPMPARPLHRSWATWAFPPVEAFIGTTDVVHGTNFVVPPAWRAAMVVTVHDLTPLHFPQMCQPATLVFPRLVRRAVHRGAWVHTPSEFVAEEVVRLLGAPPERVRAVHLGVTTPPAAAGPDGRWRRLLPEWATSYVLALGTVEPRKGLPSLVRAFGKVAGAHPSTALVIAGPDGWGAGELAGAIEACPARARVVRLGWVSDSDRDALLLGATLLAYPSVYEGFGLPPLEAMAAGTPVVATSCGALEEVLGDSAVLVRPGDVGALAEAIDGLLAGERDRTALAERGKLRAQGYTWQACAQGLADLYRDAAGTR